MDLYRYSLNSMELCRFSLNFIDFVLLFLVEFHCFVLIVQGFFMDLYRMFIIIIVTFVRIGGIGGIKTTQKHIITMVSFVQFGNICINRLIFHRFSLYMFDPQAFSLGTGVKIIKTIDPW